MFVGPWTSLNFHFLYDRSSDIMMFTEVHRATRVPFGNQITKGGNGGSPASCFWSRNSWLVIISMYPIKFHYSKFHWYPINIPLNSMCIPLISHEYTMSYPVKCRKKSLFSWFNVREISFHHPDDWGHEHQEPSPHHCGVQGQGHRGAPGLMRKPWLKLQKLDKNWTSPAWKWDSSGQKLKLLSSNFGMGSQKITIVFWGTLSDKLACVKPKRHHRLDDRARARWISQQEYLESYCTCTS